MLLKRCPWASKALIFHFKPWWFLFWLQNVPQKKRSSRFLEIELVDIKTNGQSFSLVTLIPLTLSDCICPWGSRPDGRKSWKKFGFCCCWPSYTFLGKSSLFLLIPNTNHPLTWRLYFRPPPPTFAWLKLGSFIRKQSCESGNFPNPHFASPLWSLLAFRYSFWSTFVTERGEDWKAALCVLSIKLGIPAWNCHILEYYYAIVLSKSAASHHISLGCSICHEISPF